MPGSRSSRSESTKEPVSRAMTATEAKSITPGTTESGTNIHNADRRRRGK
ncbi:hypothetical protein MY494_07745 [Synechococcus sp. A10-1-5-1]|nr:hypothetical protein [Synechococcus sp. A10-1-5-1]UPM51596.1 hypothetical protein MY494_07745 [Synechococcus sp. A10-1-5-1]